MAVWIWLIELLVFLKFTLADDAIQVFHPDPALPKALNDFLLDVQNHRNDFKAIRQYVNNNRYKKDVDNFLNFDYDTLIDRPQNDLYPYMYRKEDQSNNNRYRRQLTRDSVEIQTNSNFGEINLSENKYPERFIDYKQFINEIASNTDPPSTTTTTDILDPDAGSQPKIKSDPITNLKSIHSILKEAKNRKRDNENRHFKRKFQESRSLESDADSDAVKEKRDLDIEVRNDGKIIKTIHENAKDPKSIVLNFNPVNEEPIRGAGTEVQVFNSQPEEETTTITAESIKNYNKALQENISVFDNQDNGYSSGPIINILKKYPLGGEESKEKFSIGVKNGDDDAWYNVFLKNKPKESTTYPVITLQQQMNPYEEALGNSAFLTENEKRYRTADSIYVTEENDRRARMKSRYKNLKRLEEERNNELEKKMQEEDEANGFEEVKGLVVSPKSKKKIHDSKRDLDSEAYVNEKEVDNENVEHDYTNENLYSFKHQISECGDEEVEDKDAQKEDSKESEDTKRSENQIKKRSKKSAENLKKMIYKIVSDKMTEKSEAREHPYKKTAAYIKYFGMPHNDHVKDHSQDKHLEEFTQDKHLEHSFEGLKDPVEKYEVNLKQSNEDFNDLTPLSNTIPDLERQNIMDMEIDHKIKQDLAYKKSNFPFLDYDTTYRPPSLLSLIEEFWGTSTSFYPEVVRREAAFNKFDAHIGEYMKIIHGLKEGGGQEMRGVAKVRMQERKFAQNGNNKYKHNNNNNNNNNNMNRANVGRNLKSVSDEEDIAEAEEKRSIPKDDPHRGARIKSEATEGDYGDEEDSFTFKDKTKKFSMVKKTNNEFANPRTTVSEKDYYDDNDDNEEPANDSDESQIVDDKSQKLIKHHEDDSKESEEAKLEEKRDMHDDVAEFTQHRHKKKNQKPIVKNKPGIRKAKNRNSNKLRHYYPAIKARSSGEIESATPAEIMRENIQEKRSLNSDIINAINKDPLLKSLKISNLYNNQNNDIEKRNFDAPVSIASLLSVDDILKNKRCGDYSKGTPSVQVSGPPQCIFDNMNLYSTNPPAKTGSDGLEINTSGAATTDLALCGNNETDDSKVGALLSGRVAYRIVNNMYEKVQQDPQLQRRFKHGLNKNRNQYLEGFHNCEKSTNIDTDKLMMQIAELIKKFMSDSATCMNLFGPLEKYLENILSPKNDNEQSCTTKSHEEFDKHESSMLFQKVSSRSVQLFCPDKAIQERVNSLSSLLDKYYKLPLQCQQHAKLVKEYITNHLRMLKSSGSCRTNKELFNDSDEHSPEMSQQKLQQQQMANYPGQGGGSAGVSSETAAAAASPSPSAPAAAASEANPLVEKQLESVGLGKRSDFHPNFDLNEVMEKNFESQNHKNMRLMR